VKTWLEEVWSLKEIVNRLTSPFPVDPSMQASHETTYRSLFVHGRSELRGELARCLRLGRSKRLTQGWV
jgi:IS30 family transposase